MEDSPENQNINITISNDNINTINNSNNNNIIQYNPNIINDNSEKKIIKKISDLFSDICATNTKEFSKENNSITKPFITINPSITIRDYLERLYKYSKMSISTVILILIYIDRISNINKFKLTYYIIHKLILSSMVVAIKYNEDDYFSMKHYAKLGGISKAEMINLEFYFVTLLNYNLFVKIELFNKYNDNISSADSEDEEYEELEDSSENDDNNNIKNNNNLDNNNNIKES